MTRIKLFITLNFLLWINQLESQVNHTLYFMERIPQSNQINPALQPNCNVYIGLPGLSSFYFDIGNNSLNAKSIFQYNSTLDSLITFLHPQADRTIFFNDLKEKNNFYNAFQYDILSFGFKVRNLYFHFNTSLKSYTYLTYPRSLMELILKGSDVGTITDLKSFGIYNTTYGEVSFGLSNNFENDFILGAKLKILSGINNISTNNKKFLVETYEDQNNRFINSFASDVSFRIYAPYLEDTPNGADLSLDSLLKLKDKPQESIKPFESMGVAFDLGVLYTGIENVKLSASLVDIGLISWNKNTYELKMRSSYSIPGVEIDRDSLENAFENPLGSIKDSVTFSKFPVKYSTALPMKLYLGGEYFLETYFSFGLMSVTQYYVKSIYQQFTFSSNFRPLRSIMLSLSYSFINNGFSNIGAGITFRPLPPFQFYLLFDNIPIRYGKQYIPIYARSANIRFGLNLTFGYRHRIKDKPLSWE
ncbi:MAG: DUF5723 family protein [Bacteroidales bacterium]|nr:DUF5723 family protein [Bacteroidales bacterium]